MEVKLCVLLAIIFGFTHASCQVQQVPELGELWKDTISQKFMVYSPAGIIPANKNNAHSITYIIGIGEKKENNTINDKWYAAFDRKPISDTSTVQFVFQFKFANKE